MRGNAVGPVKGRVPYMAGPERGVVGAGYVRPIRYEETDGET